MDAALLPEIAEAVTEGYVAGLCAGGWGGPPDVVQRAIVVCGAAKYCWFAPRALGRVIRGRWGHPQYGRDATGEDALRRLRGLVALLAHWARTILP